MKKNVHPEYKETIIKCACGATIATKSTAQDLVVDICSQCHPFFTGQQKFVDAAGNWTSSAYKTNVKYDNNAPNAPAPAIAAAKKPIMPPPPITAPNAPNNPIAIQA